MPNILIPSSPKRIEFYLIDADSDRYKEQLKNIIKIYNLNLVKSPIINGVSFVQVHGFQHDQWDGFVSAIKLGFVEKVLFGNELSKIIVDKLIASKETITCSESCSGGLLASELVKHSGVSAIFRGSVVTYANEIKSLLVNVSSDTLEKYGAVSQEVVLEMLDGSISLLNSDFALAISGVAGPTGGTIEKPIGTVIVGAKSRKGETIIKKLHLSGDRRYIQEQSVLWALKLLILTRKDTFF
jgi:nicotinamide-nucleotide amidase